ncbi:MAG: hypothetical protein JJT75_07310 [Opitutales bacterium]|nr:hypothetical protein [Opitutales bacterium]MCH8540922.1 hypothetical protein [Opitutales bacterium]
MISFKPYRIFVKIIPSFFLAALPGLCLTPLAGAEEARHPGLSHPLEETNWVRAYDRRANFIIEQTAASDLDELQAWFDRVSFFQNGGGDPHKFALPAITSRLFLDPEDESARSLYRHLMEVDTLKDDRGLYHFAAFMRARLHLELGDVLPEDFRKATEYDVRNYTRILRRGGTENHRFMHRASGLIFAEKIEGEYAGEESREDHLAALREWALEEGRLMFTRGSGEYDSSTYVSFTVASLLNVYDFTEDEELRKAVRAMLDWQAAGMAHKYFHGVNMGPEARGFASNAVGHRDEKPGFPGIQHLTHEPAGSNTDWISWLWWGASNGNVRMGEPGAAVPRYPVHIPAMSGYRPPEILRDLARKTVELPYEARGSNPDFRRNIGGRDQEVLFVDREYAMSTLYSPLSGEQRSGSILPQTTTFKILMRDENAIRAFGAQNGYHSHRPLEGLSPFDQHHQAGNAALVVTYVDAEEEGPVHHRSLFGFPQAVGNPVQDDSGWNFWEVKDAFLAVYPLGKEPTLVDGPLPGYRRDQGFRYLHSAGPLGGWVIQLGQRSEEYPDLETFQEAVISGTKKDLEAFSTERKVRFTSLSGETLALRHTGGPGGHPDAWRNGKKLDWENWPVWESPYLHQDLEGGVLTLSNGKETLTIDWNDGAPQWTRSDVENDEQ